MNVLLIYAKDENTHTTKKNTDLLLDASKEDVLDVNTTKSLH
jgi:hypothetical protein